MSFIDCVFKELVHFIQVCIKFFILLYYPLMSMGSVVMASHLFLILVICVSSFFPLVRLARRSSILLIISKKQIWVLFNLSIIFLFLISSISALLFIISFLLLTLDFLCSFSSFLR